MELAPVHGGPKATTDLSRDPGLRRRAQRDHFFETAVVENSAGVTRTAEAPGLSERSQVAEAGQRARVEHGGARVDDVRDAHRRSHVDVAADRNRAREKRRDL